MSEKKQKVISVSKKSKYETKFEDFHGKSQFAKDLNKEIQKIVDSNEEKGWDFVDINHDPKLFRTGIIIFRRLREIDYAQEVHTKEEKEKKKAKELGEMAKDISKNILAKIKDDLDRWEQRLEEKYPKLTRGARKDIGSVKESLSAVKK